MAKVLGIKLAPLKVPLHRRLETLAVAQWTFCFLFLGFTCLFLSIYVLVATKYYWVILLYGVYYHFDKSKSARGGRRSEWVRRWTVWKYFAAFFPMKIVKTADLDPEKNYIMGFHPHGILSTSAFCHFGTEGSGWSLNFPGIRPYLLVLAGHFQFPFYRDYLMLSGTVEVTSDSMRYLLTKNGKGNAVALVVGGALEALEAFPEKFNLKLKKKKGFIKLALTTGASLLPVYSFGETDIFQQTPNPPGSMLRKLQTVMTKYLGFSPPLFHGRGIFNYTFGLIPYRKPVNTVFGEPIDVKKTEAPTQEEIDTLHQKYLDSLEQMFETHKQKYGLKESQKLNFIE